MPLLTKPYQFQKDAACRIEKFGGRCLVAGEMGVGKSLLCLLWAYRSEEQALPIVVVCPATLKHNWRREMARHFDWYSEVLEGTKASSLTDGAIVPSRVIINYDILGAWLPHLIDLKPGLVILDECHYLINPRARRTKAVQRLCQDVPHVLALSGTPMVNRPIELWPVLSLLAPATFDDFRDYAECYCDPKLTPWGWDLKGASNLPSLNRKLNRTCMIRLRKKDVLPELPAMTWNVLPVPLPAKGRKEYDRIKGDIRKWYAGQGKYSKSSKTVTALAKFGELKRCAAEHRTGQVLEWVGDFLDESPGESLIVFCVHHRMIDAIKGKFKDHCVEVSGRTKLTDRDLAVQSFQAGRKRLFVGQIQAAGVGLTLTRASTVLFAEVGERPGDVIQAAARAHRIGQKSNVNVYLMVALKTIEERLCDMLQSKQRNISTVLDGAGKGDELDLYDLYLKELGVK